jgi:pimeloyl-ACP methyl ester carboxylesterase
VKGELVISPRDGLGRQEASTGIVDVPGAQLAYDTAGEGRPALLFVHGGGCNRRDWSRQLSSLSDQFTTVALDLRGHGSSTVVDPDSCTIQEMAADLIRLLDHLAIDHAVLVGHSFGCRVVLQAAAVAPSRTAGVVLVDGSRVWTGDAAAVSHRQADQFSDVRTHYEQILTAPAFFVHADEQTRAPIRASMLTTPEPVLRAIGLSTGPWDAQLVETVVAGVTSPVLAIQSTYWSDTEARRTLAPGEVDTPWLRMLRTNNARVAVDIVPDTGHFVMIEAARHVDSTIRSFAAGLSHAQ